MIEPTLEAVLDTLKLVAKVATMTLDVAINSDSRVTDWERTGLKAICEDLASITNTVENIK